MYKRTQESSRGDKGDQTCKFLGKFWALIPKNQGGDAMLFLGGSGKNVK